jgi:hypothetical protein
VGCMGTRIALVFIAAFGSPEILKVLSVFAAVIAAGFATIYLGGLRKTGIETGGKPIWWNELRPVHAAIYAAVAYLAWNGRGDLAWKLLAIDVVIGLSSFVAHHHRTLSLSL